MTGWGINFIVTVFMLFKYSTVKRANTVSVLFETTIWLPELPGIVMGNAIFHKQHDVLVKDCGAVVSP